jgi:hypothetical protein
VPCCRALILLCALQPTATATARKAVPVFVFVTIPGVIGSYLGFLLPPLASHYRSGLARHALHPKMFSRKRAETVNNTVTKLPPPPKVVDATGNWKGNDGKWSTFSINVGDKANNGGGQNFEVLPSTHFGVTVLPFQSSWCTGDCPEARGVGTVDGSQIGGVQTAPDSSTWNDAGTYDIDKPDWWQNKSDTLVGDYGLEYLGIGKASKQSYIANNMYVAATTSKDLYIGQFGLGPGATNVGKGHGEVQSILATFHNQNVIPSVSYGYTAGAIYSEYTFLSACPPLIASVLA